MLFHDRALIDGPARLTRDGYLVAEARVAKANNIQTYRAGELGITDRNPSDVIRVFRPEAEVFAHDALASAAHRPVTLDHPKEDVTSSNWRQLAVGDIGGDVIRDGDFVRVPLKVMDAKAISAARTTHQEFSLGYSADLDMTPGKFGDAEYDASMRNIRVNHLALCDSARGGPELRIVDERPPNLRDHQEQPMKIKIGDAEVDATNGEAVKVAVDVLNGKLSDATARATTAEGKLAEHAATIVARDAEIVTLKAAVEAGKITPDKLRDAAKSYALKAGKAKALGVAVTDAMDEPAIMAAVVTAKMGDAAKDYSAEQVAIAFDVLAKDAKVQDADPLRTALSTNTVHVGDGRAAAEAARKAWLAAKETAHTSQAA